MNEKLSKLLGKIRASATVAGEYASKKANSVGKKSVSAFNVSKLNLQIFDLNTDMDVIYKEIGKLIYASHLGEDTDSELLQAKLGEADEKMAKIRELKAEIENCKDEKKCPSCGNSCNTDAAFCEKCGAEF